MKLRIWLVIVKWEKWRWMKRIWKMSDCWSTYLSHPSLLSPFSISSPRLSLFHAACLFAPFNFPFFEAWRVMHGPFQAGLWPLFLFAVCLLLPKSTISYPPSIVSFFTCIPGYHSDNIIILQLFFADFLFLLIWIHPPRSRQLRIICKAAATRLTLTLILAAGSNDNILVHGRYATHTVTVRVSNHLRNMTWEAYVSCGDMGYRSKERKLFRACEFSPRDIPCSTNSWKLQFTKLQMEFVCPVLAWWCAVVMVYQGSLLTKVKHGRQWVVGMMMVQDEDTGWSRDKPCRQKCFCFQPGVLGDTHGHFELGKLNLNWLFEAYIVAPRFFGEYFTWRAHIYCESVEFFYCWHVGLYSKW